MASNGSMQKKKIKKTDGGRSAHIYLFIFFYGWTKSPRNKCDPEVLQQKLFFEVSITCSDTSISVFF